MLQSDNPTAYIGESENVRKRLKQHLEKEFWVEAIAFVSKDEDLTGSHTRYLEGHLIEEATKAGRFELENDQDSGAPLSEAAREDMEVFLAWIRQLLPILGCDILIPVVKSEKLKDSSTALVYPVKGVIAKGQRTPKGFVVFKDSEAAVDLQPATPPKIIKRRQELLEDGNLKRLAEKLGFTKDIEFTSPSAAAAIVCAGKAGGLTAWRNAEGKTLKELESEI